MSNYITTGWCLVERKGKIGWIPESYLKKTKGDDIEDCLGMIGPPEGMLLILFYGSKCTLACC